MLVKINCILLITKIKKRKKKVGLNLGNGCISRSEVKPTWNTESFPAARQLDQEESGQGLHVQRGTFHTAAPKELTLFLHPLNSCQVNHKVKPKVIYDNKMAGIHPAA